MAQYRGDDGRVMEAVDEQSVPDLLDQAAGLLERLTRDLAMASAQLRVLDLVDRLTSNKVMGTVSPIGHPLSEMLKMRAKQIRRMTDENSGK